MNAKINMFNYSKLILRKVSFSADLFENELKKAILHCKPRHLNELRRWCMKKFWKNYGTLIDQCFRDVLPECHLLPF